MKRKCKLCSTIIPKKARRSRQYCDNICSRIFYNVYITKDGLVLTERGIRLAKKMGMDSKKVELLTDRD